jgi:hypothetical protein
VAGREGRKLGSARGLEALVGSTAKLSSLSLWAGRGNGSAAEQTRYSHRRLEVDDDAAKRSTASVGEGRRTEVGLRGRWAEWPGRPEGRRAHAWAESLMARCGREAGHSAGQREGGKGNEPVTISYEILYLFPRNEPSTFEVNTN